MGQTGRTAEEKEAGSGSHACWLRALCQACSKGMRIGLFYHILVPGIFTCAINHKMERSLPCLRDASTEEGKLGLLFPHHFLWIMEKLRHFKIISLITQLMVSPVSSVPPFLPHPCFGDFEANPTPYIIASIIFQQVSLENKECF